MREYRSVTITVREVSGTGFVGIVKVGWRKFLTSISKSAKQAYYEARTLAENIFNKSISVFEKIRDRLFCVRHSGTENSPTLMRL